jgi:hypothetical protein
MLMSGILMSGMLGPGIQATTPWPMFGCAIP